MGQRYVTAIRSVSMFGLMTSALMLRRTRALSTQRMLIYMVTMHMVQMTIMRVANMIVMLNSLMTASSAMFMVVRVMCFATHRLQYSPVLWNHSITKNC